MPLYQVVANADSLGKDMDSHVTYQHVQEAMYHAGQTNMQAVSIKSTVLPLPEND